MAVNRQKLKLLYLMRMLQEETDSEQGLTMTQILERLEEEGVMAERKSVYRDIEALREFGLDIRTYQRSPVEYALENRDFALPELLLLVDAVQRLARFLTQRKSDALVRSVEQLASARQRALLDKRLHVEGRIKSQNESVFHNVDRIQEALARRRKITFLYFQYDAAKKKILQHDGAFYTETPVQLIYADGFYYLVAYNEKHGALAHYRVDRMDKIEVTDQPACRNELRRRLRRARFGKPCVRHVRGRAGFRGSFWWRPAPWAPWSTGSGATCSRCRWTTARRACGRRS